VRTRKETNAKQQKSKSEMKPIPTWKKRNEEKIIRARCDIAHLAEYFQKKRKLEQESSCRCAYNSQEIESEGHRQGAGKK
jgi:peptidyl-tRNA hydrolase